MSGLSKILSNSGWMAGEQVVRLVVGLFVGVWIARHLGPTDFGALSYAISFTSLIGIFAALGLNRIVIRELSLCSENDEFRHRLISSVFAVRVLASIGCFLLAVGISLFAKQGDLLLVGIVALGFVFGAFEVIDLHFQALTQSRFSVVARSAAFFAGCILKVLLLLNDAEVVAFALAAVFEIAISGMFLRMTYRLAGLSLEMRYASIRYGCSLLRESWPEIFAGFACLIFMRIDQIMLGNMIGEEAVGVYSVASRLAESWYFIPTALVTSSFPSIVRQRQADKELYLRRLHQLMTGLVILAYAAGGGITLLADWGINLLYGPAYSEAAHVLVVLVWCGVFVSLGIASGSWIMAERQPVLNLARNVLGAFANIGLNSVLIPKYGICGAAYGTLISQTIAYFASDFIHPRTRPIGFMKLKSLFFCLKMRESLP